MTRHPRILVAEDDAILRYTTAKVLSCAGYSVIEAPDGISALRIIEQEAGEIDVLVTNVSMPHMHGHDLAREAKKVRPELRVLIVSGTHERDFPPEAVHHADTLMKPVDPATLLGRVQELLKHRSDA